MIPFLSDALEGMIRKIMNMYIRKEVLREANTVRKVIKIDFENVENRLPVDMVNPRTAMKAILLSEEITDGSIYQLRKGCVVFLTQLILKLQERKKILQVFEYPMLFVIITSQYGTKPTESYNSIQSSGRKHQFDHVLPSIADSAKKKFEKYLSLDTFTKDNFMQFDFLKSRVGEFLGAHFKDKTVLLTICKLIFTLSHSQYVVECDLL